MGTTNQATNPQPQPAQPGPKFMAEVLDQLPLTAHHDQSGSVELTKQRKRRDDGKYGREFLKVKIALGRAALFLDTDTVIQLHDALGAMLPKIKALNVQMEEERKAREEAWQQRKAEQAAREAGTNGTRRTGKTERNRAKGKAGPDAHAKRKREKAERSREERKKACGAKKGK